MLKDFIGFGSLSEALTSLARHKYTKVLVVASDSAWRRFQPQAAHPLFARSQVSHFGAFGTNPDFRDILKGAKCCREFGPDLIIAIGGGSPIDVAKVIKAEVFTRESYSADKPDSIIPSGDGPPVVAIATTAGSGAEATQFAVFYLGETKQSMSHPSLRPDMAVVDPELTYSMPPDQTAATGFDALSQAIEAYWAASSTPEAQQLAGKAIEYALPNLYNAVTAPNPGNRYNMAMAAHLAGKAINFTRTTLPHALGYHLTKRYHLAHGHAVALTLPYCFILNMDAKLAVNPPLDRQSHEVNMRRIFALLGVNTAEDAFTFWRNLLKACGLASTLHDVGLTTTDQIRALVATVNPDRLKNHPVAVTPDYLVDCFINRP